MNPVLVGTWKGTRSSVPDYHAENDEVEIHADGTIEYRTLLPGAQRCRLEFRAEPDGDDYILHSKSAGIHSSHLRMKIQAIGTGEFKILRAGYETSYRRQHRDPR